LKAVVAGKPLRAVIGLFVNLQISVAFEKLF